MWVKNASEVQNRSVMLPDHSHTLLDSFGKQHVFLCENVGVRGKAISNVWGFNQTLTHRSLALRFSVICISYKTHSVIFYCDIIMNMSFPSFLAFSFIESICSTSSDACEVN